MPVNPTYPGVYIEELPSGVRTIVGVATSIAAFAGWAAKGPTDRAQLVLSWADFERYFGGLDVRSYLGYAVYQFFANGGTQAYIVRLAASDAASATVSLDSALDITAKNPGQWANSYGITIKASTFDSSRFQLAVVNGSGTKVETFENLSMDNADRRFVETVINNESLLVDAAVAGGATTPPSDTSSPAALSGGADGAVLSPDTSAFETALIPTSADSGVYHLDRVDLFNLLCVPGESTPATLSSLEGFCRERRAFLIADSAMDDGFSDLQNGPDGALTGDDGINAAFYFPWVNAPNPLKENKPEPYPPCGFVAGLYARTDTNRGVWKAPAGTEASLRGVTGVTETLTDGENGVLNPQAINCIRTFPVYGTILWGARTLRGNDQIGSEWKYIPVRRMALFLEESLYRALKWVVFEPNDEPLWAQIRLNVGAFMHNLFRQGAFQGTTPQAAYFVKCDKETTTQNDINLGIVNIIVGFAPLKPAEFVIIKIQQMAGQIEV
jgi:uncharacterized protein